MLLLNIKQKTKNSAGCAMTFCKEMLSRVEEPFCKNICFSGITNYCSDLYMFLIRLNHQEFWQAMMPKKQKIQKDRRWQRKGILTNRLLENQRDRGKKAGNQKLLPYTMIPKNAI